MRVLLGTLSLSILTAACFGTEVPPQKPTADPMAGAKPVGKQEDVSKREDKANARMAGSFDKVQTQVSINRGARQATECAKIHTEGPFGTFTMKVIIDPSGKVKDAQPPAPFAGTPIGKCVESAFEHELIPPWDGKDETLESTVTLKKPDGPPPATDPKKK